MFNFNNKTINENLTANQKALRDRLALAKNAEELSAAYKAWLGSTTKDGIKAEGAAFMFRYWAHFKETNTKGVDQLFDLAISTIDSKGRNALIHTYFGTDKNLIIQYGTQYQIDTFFNKLTAEQQASFLKDIVENHMGYKIGDGAKVFAISQQTLDSLQDFEKAQKFAATLNTSQQLTFLTHVLDLEQGNEKMHNRKLVSLLVKNTVDKDLASLASIMDVLVNIMHRDDVDGVQVEIGKYTDLLDNLISSNIKNLVKNDAFFAAFKKHISKIDQSLIKVLGAEAKKATGADKAKYTELFNVLVENNTEKFVSTQDYTSLLTPETSKLVVAEVLNDDLNIQIFAAKADINSPFFKVLFEQAMAADKIDVLVKAPHVMEYIIANQNSIDVSTLAKVYTTIHHDPAVRDLYKDDKAGIVSEALETLLKGLSFENVKELTIELKTQLDLDMGLKPVLDAMLAKKGMMFDMSQFYQDVLVVGNQTPAMRTRNYNSVIEHMVDKGVSYKDVKAFAHKYVDQSGYLKVSDAAEIVEHISPENLSAYIALALKNKDFAEARLFAELAPQIFMEAMLAQAPAQITADDVVKVFAKINDPALFKEALSRGQIILGTHAFATDSKLLAEVMNSAGFKTLDQALQLYAQEQRLFENRAIFLGTEKAAWAYSTLANEVWKDSEKAAYIYDIVGKNPDDKKLEKLNELLAVVEDPTKLSSLLIEMMNNAPVAVKPLVMQYMLDIAKMPKLPNALYPALDQFVLLDTSNINLTISRGGMTTLSNLMQDRIYLHETSTLQYPAGEKGSTYADSYRDFLSRAIIHNFGKATEDTSIRFYGYILHAFEAMNIEDAIIKQKVLNNVDVIKATLIISDADLIQQLISTGNYIEIVKTVYAELSADEKTIVNAKLKEIFKNHNVGKEYVEGGHIYGLLANKEIALAVVGTLTINEERLKDVFAKAPVAALENVFDGIKLSNTIYVVKGILARTIDEQASIIDIAINKNVDSAQSILDALMVNDGALKDFGSDKDITANAKLFAMVADKYAKQDLSIAMTKLEEGNNLDLYLQGKGHMGEIRKLGGDRIATLEYILDKRAGLDKNSLEAKALKAYYDKRVFMDIKRLEGYAVDKATFENAVTNFNTLLDSPEFDKALRMNPDDSTSKAPTVYVENMLFLSLESLEKINDKYKEVHPGAQTMWEAIAHWFMELLTKLELASKDEQDAAREIKDFLANPILATGKAADVVNQAPSANPNVPQISQDEKKPVEGLNLGKATFKDGTGLSFAEKIAKQKEAQQNQPIQIK